MTGLRDRERLEQLLADEATEGLDAVGVRERDTLLAEHPDVDVDGFMRAAAAWQRVVWGGEVDELPAGLAGRVVAAVRAEASAAGDGSLATPAPAPIPLADARSASATTGATSRARPTAATPVRITRSGVWGGWLAAAAALVIAVLGWTREPVPAKPISLAVQRDTLVREARDLLRVEWAAPEDPAYAAVTGDVVWSTQRQAGFLRLSGLPVNDPDEAQYQLWIVDPSRDAEPVDGGVFDVGPDGEQIIAIDAKLRVDRPTVFALTLEQPGGVVVSEGPLLVVAQA